MKISLILCLTGIALIVLGFTYDIFFAGIPCQDPAPDMVSEYQFHSSVAYTLEISGLIILAVSAAFFVINRVFQKIRTA